MSTLFLNPPSFRGFDGGAGSRYQARREIRSFWYPTWLAQAAALVDGSRLIDAPADDLTAEDVLKSSRDCSLVVMFTSTPSIASDARLALRMKKQRPEQMIGFVGPHVSVLAEESLRESGAVDFVVRGEFDLPIREIAEGSSLADVRGVSWRDGGNIRHNPDSDPITDLDSLPFVVDVYKRDLTIENYFIGYLMHPYLSLYTGRGCPGRCTFCLWPQTMSGHTYRVRSPESVCRELAQANELFPQVKEFFLDDDTFTADRERAERIARGLGSLGITWSTSSRVTVPRDTLMVMKENGLRLLMVGYESGSDEILRNARKGITTDLARRFTQDCKSLGIALHGTFMVGLPGETRETVEQTIRFAREIDPHTIQVSIAAPYPGTELYRQARENGWLVPSELVSANGTQTCPLEYPEMSSGRILESVDRIYRAFYFRPRVMARIGKQMLSDSDVRRRRLREGGEFFAFLRQHRNGAKHSQGVHAGMLRRVLKDGGPGFCQFAVTDACNATCEFCNFNVNFKAARRRTFVAKDEALASLDILAENGIDYLAFVGGEPTMHPELPAMISHCRALGMNPIICTNGALLSPERIRQYIDAGLGSAIISVDAPSVEEHECNRGLPGVCERIAAANLELRAAGVPTTASVTISRLLGDLSELPGFLEKLNFDRVTFSYPLRSLPSSFLGYSDSRLIDFSDDELDGMFERIKVMKKRFPVANPRASLEEMQRFIGGQKQQFPCLAGFKYFYLDWNLDLYRCHAWHERMCSIFEFDSSRLIRDGCTCCMIDCYRDASVLQAVGIALFDAKTEFSRGRLGSAASRLLNRSTAQAARSVLEDLGWVRRF